MFREQPARRLTAVALALSLSLAGTACDAGEPTEEPALTIQLPGAEPYPAELQARLRAAVDARGEGYEPRTHHLRDDGSAVYTNRLIFEDSPYLIQHAHNPVNWYPWGPEAFARAAREDKPIFLSIGYSTCHWCHVMERESFEDAEIARLLNEKFVCVKVDREQRPDVDEVYMTAVQLTTGRGGWPMSSFLTPDGKPFFGGTYFPPQQFTTLLQRVDEAWKAQRGELVASAERVAAAVAEVTAARGEAEEVGQEAFAKAVESLLASHDARLGGFGGAPKFPHEPELLFLLERALREPHPEALAAVTTSLDAMARGGIYDQVGGGFHRYSTDDRWLVPHFEKMLYNQAHLARAYLDAYRLTGNAFFARVARQTLDYVLREMTSPGGGFYSAADADSEGEEGRFFVWTPDQIRAALDPEDAALVLDLFAVTEAGNFEGRNILNLPVGFADYAAKKDLKLADLLARVDRIREALWQVREKREHPIRDDKVLTAWNGMMVTALAAGSEVLGDRRYLDAARRAAELVWKENRRGDGELWRVHLNGSSSIAAVQEDYAYLAEAFVALYDQTGETAWLARAREVVDGMAERFWDAADGGFFMSAEKGDPHLIARPKSPSDGAIPSGNSVAVRALAQLAARTGEASYGDRARATLAAFAGQLAQAPAGYGYMLLGADGLLNGEAGARRYAAAGTVRASADLTPEGDGFAVTLSLRIRDGWHVNAHQPLQEELIPTELTAASPWRLAAIEYPVPETVRLGFQEEPLAVYQGTVAITGRASESDMSDPSDLSDLSDSFLRVVPLRLRIQACNHEVCLRPEEILLRVTAAHSR